MKNKIIDTNSHGFVSGTTYYGKWIDGEIVWSTDPDFVKDVPCGGNFIVQPESTTNCLVIRAEDDEYKK